VGVGGAGEGLGGWGDGRTGEWGGGLVSKELDQGKKVKCQQEGGREGGQQTRTQEGGYMRVQEGGCHFMLLLRSNRLK